MKRGTEPGFRGRSRCRAEHMPDLGALGLRLARSSRTREQVAGFYCVLLLAFPRAIDQRRQRSRFRGRLMLPTRRIDG